MAWNSSQGRASRGEQAQRRADRVAVLAGICMTILMLVMLARVAQLQLRPSEVLADHVQARVSTRPELPLRGDIMDREGRPLSVSRFGTRVFADPEQLPKPVDGAIVRLAETLGVSADELGTRIATKLAENEKRRAALPPEAPKQPSTVLAKLIASAKAGSTATEPSKAASPTAASPTVAADSTPKESTPDPKSDAIASLNDPTGTKPVTMDGDSPVLPVDGSESDVPAPGPKKLIRYVPISDILTDEQAEAVKKLKIKGVHFERRPVREYPGGAAVASLVGKVDVDHHGLIGAEKMLDEQLQGISGKVQYVRDASGRPLWIEPGQVQAATPGQDVRLSLDLEVQRIALEELQRGIEDADAAGGRIVVFDPYSGEIVAMGDVLRDMPDLAEYPWAVAKKKGDKSPDTSRPPPPKRYRVLKPDPQRAKHPGLGRNRCIEDVYEPGSTFKSFVWSTITELKLASPDEIFDTEGGRWHTPYGRYIEDVTKRATMSWREVLINSSNIGMVKGASRLSFVQLHDAVKRFGFGKRTGVGLPGEATGLVTPISAWSKYSQTSVATGYEVAVTPLQMVRAFSVFCRPGNLAGTLPPVRLTAAADVDPMNSVVVRVLPVDVAKLARETMAHVAENMQEALDKTSHEHNWRYSMFGKSGTAEIPLGKAPEGFRRPRGVTGYFDDQYNTSFIAGGPIENPRLVVLCVIDDPGPARIRARTHYGAKTAGPVVRRVMERALTYLGTPPSPKPESVAAAQN
ncbi:MAG: penicillin-binding protein 2 [Planctomycetota bacterium]|nr:penicillin-binding protein 2 [Planctomycetota bacterium]